MRSRFSLIPNPSVMDSESVNLLSYWDKELVCRFANQEFFKLFGKPSEEIIGRVNLKTLLAPLYEQHHQYIKGVLNGHSQNYESEIFLRPGEKYKVVSTYYPDIEDGMVLGFFAHITNLKEFIKPNQLANGQPHSNKESKMKEAILNQNNTIYEVAAYIKSQILSEFTSIEYLAELHGISVSKLMRDFKSRFKTSPYLYYRRLQMEFAETYMERTGCSKKQMAVMLGFSNPTNFVVCYKKYLLESKSNFSDLNLIKNGEQKKTLISQLPFSVALLDLQLTYLEVSDLWISEFNFHDINLVGSSLLDFFPGTARDKEKIMLKYSTFGLTQCEGELRMNANTETRELKWIIKQWFDESGNLGGIIVYSV